MPKTVAVTCQVCLSVNDPNDVLTVAISPPQFEYQQAFKLCRLCTLAIMKSAVVSELIDPSEVFNAVLGDAPHAPAQGDAPGEGAAADLSSPAAAPRVDENGLDPQDLDEQAEGGFLPLMPGGKCALDCGNLAADDDIYCAACRATLRE